MTEDERTALVTASDIRQVMDDYGFSVDLDMNGEHDVSQTLLSMTEEVARLRVENRLLAAHDLDALLDSVDRVVVVSDDGRQFDRTGLYAEGAFVSIQDEGRTLKVLPAAIRNAVAQAQGRGEGDV